MRDSHLVIPGYAPLKGIANEMFSWLFKLFITSIFIANPSSDIFCCFIHWTACYTYFCLCIEKCSTKSSCNNARYRIRVNSYLTRTMSDATDQTPNVLKHEACAHCYEWIHWLCCLSPIYPVALCRCWGPSSGSALVDSWCYTSRTSASSLLRSTHW